MKIISKTATKSCELDPMNTNILKDNISVLAPVLVDIVNTSLEDAIVTENLKSAMVRLLLKKPGLPLIFKNFRPVSNLSYLSKLIERVVCEQIMFFAEKSGNLEKYQLAYRPNHSTETALLKVRTDLLAAIDRKEVTCLILLDLSAAFDTVDHQLLLNRLRFRFGIEGKCLEWIESYLTNRNQQVVIGSHQSSSKQLTQGVPQGSVLGPILFTLYMSPLGDICRRHGIDFHGYADDSQNYLSFRPSRNDNTPTQDCLLKLQNCIDEIRKWMGMNLLKLNNDKTEFLMVGTQYQLSVAGDLGITIGQDLIKSCSVVRNLGVMFDRNLKSTTHVNKLVSISYVTMRNITRIRHSLDQDTLKTLCQALVMSKIDYCNSTLLGTANYNLVKLQRVQNMLCRIVTATGKYDKISDQMIGLHWLKVEYRIIFKIAILMFRCVNNMAPSDLTDLISTGCRHNLNLHSQAQGLLPTARARTTQVHKQSFALVGPRIWNSLPDHIKMTNTIDKFKASLKTHLFQKCYGLS